MSKINLSVVESAVRFHVVQKYGSFIISIEVLWVPSVVNLISVIRVLSPVIEIINIDILISFRVVLVRVFVFVIFW